VVGCGVVGGLSGCWAGGTGDRVGVWVVVAVDSPQAHRIHSAVRSLSPPVGRHGQGAERGQRRWFAGGLTKNYGHGFTFA